MNALISRIRWSRLLFTAALAGGAWVVLQPEDTGDIAQNSAEATAEAAASLMTDRLWIDHIPRNERDMVTHMYFSEAERIGVLGRASKWRQQGELFEWSSADSQLTLRFPQTDQSVTVPVKVFACKGQAPEPFDLCLEIKQGRKGLTLYSVTDWGESGQELLTTLPTDEDAVSGDASALLSLIP